MSQDNAAEFIACLMHARTTAHMLHLQTRSYAEHKALEGFYEGIVDALDSYAEAYQGLYGIIETYPGGFTVPTESPALELKKIALAVRTQRKGLPQDSELQNLIDEIADLIDGTIYKFRFLK